MDWEFTLSKLPLLPKNSLLVTFKFTQNRVNSLCFKIIILQNVDIMIFLNSMIFCTENDVFVLQTTLPLFTV